MINLSKHSFTLDVFKVLNKDLNFCPSQPPYDKNKLQDDLRAFYGTIEIKAHFGITGYKPTILQSLNKTIIHLSQITLTQPFRLMKSQ